MFFQKPVLSIADSWFIKTGVGVFLFLVVLTAGSAQPLNFTAEPYECHVELRWQTGVVAGATSYQVWRSTDGGSFSLLKTVPATAGSYIDWVCDEGNALTRHYRLKAVVNGSATDVAGPLAAQTFAMSDDQLLDMVQRYTLRYFWDFAHPASGMARERNSSGNIVTSGGTGFGIMAIVVGVERGWIPRDQAVLRLINMVSFLQTADRFHGVFPHWMDGNTGNVQPFSQFDDGGDLVETAFLMQGLLAARQYFDDESALETALRDAITGLWEDVEWDWYRKNNSPVLYWHWSPNHGWQMNFQIRGFNEAQIIYLLAIASPTHGVPASLYQTGWAGGAYTSSASYFGLPIYTSPFGGGPLFFAHYSYLGFDPRDKKDQYCNYFNRNRNHALIQRSYCTANPENHPGYSAQCWGLTASDNPWGYLAHDIQPANDNGTIAPTAALASMPYTPQASMDALKHFYRVRGEKLWGIYGFYDAFNLGANWYADSYLAIDQGPIVAMIENYRSGLLWDLFMQIPEIQQATTAVGFVPDLVSDTDVNTAITGLQMRAQPIPLAAGNELTIMFESDAPRRLEFQLLDAGSRLLQILPPADVPYGESMLKLPIAVKQPGLYLLRVRTWEGQTNTIKLTIF